MHQSPNFLADGLPIEREQAPLKLIDKQMTFAPLGAVEALYEPGITSRQVVESFARQISFHDHTCLIGYILPSRLTSQYRVCNLMLHSCPIRLFLAHESCKSKQR